ncbi:DapH/DapD/GlmU-related protein [Rhodococcus sp. H36-A4]|uniref:acyltransferase n=1 Tax=Rhodococcus sp. H36-A4 TaxID=3004353 RepID=UPI0022AE732B|nr:DapH/DapD/GlmU-related protein [Rhodococcus sp. H36-A4]MCZ4076996.1 DapH/DapD/GlmU-related protein [Rhodococcus sp. H36-A4]
MASPSNQIRYIIRSFIINGVLSSMLIPTGMRWRLYRVMGIKVCRSRIYPGAFLASGRNVEIGQGVFLNYDAFIDSSAPVVIGDGVSFGMKVSIVTSSHQIGPSSKRAGAGTCEPVTIGIGAWLGANVTVQPGVTVGEGCVVGAGSLVTKNCEPNGLYVGIPARRVRDLD